MLQPITDKQESPIVWYKSLNIHVSVATWDLQLVGKIVIWTSILSKSKPVLVWTLFSHIRGSSYVSICTLICNPSLQTCFKWPSQPTARTFQPIATIRVHTNLGFNIEHENHGFPKRILFRSLISSSMLKFRGEKSLAVSEYVGFPKWRALKPSKRFGHGCAAAFGEKSVVAKCGNCGYRSFVWWLGYDSARILDLTCAFFSNVVNY